MNPKISDEVLMIPAMDRILDILRERQRRLILVMLNRGEVESVTDVLSRGSDVGEIKLELVHNHLPKLEAAGYIEWDRETGEIRKGEQFDEIAPLLELIEDHADELPPDWP